MTSHSLSIDLDFDEGIDRKALSRLRDRFVTVNQARWSRAHSALTYRQQVVLEVLPLVFHLNHPSLPGYLDKECPCGLSGYTPSEIALNAAQRLARTFAMRSGGSRSPDLDALFLMGSPGTLGHSVTSDLDIWLCHREELPDHGVELLERKAAQLSEWAGTLGVELHVFVFSAADFRQGRQRVEVTGENCGSAQHFLLLDEFYRTAIHLGGRYPLWWLIPAEEESRYEERARQLVECRFIRDSEYIDFGAVPAIPPGEFLGAGVWQLYKGIESPWKSILKLLLIECYALDRSGGLLSLAFKSEVFSGETNPDALDPYVLLYCRLERWLLESGAESRLEVVRRCLYLKAGLPLSRVGQAADTWRSRMLQSLVDHWRWGPTELRWLDGRQSWRAEDVMTLRRAIVGELTHSYRLLSRLAREHGAESAISPADMSLLGRKLYAAFQRKAGKVEQINPGIASSMAEENLSFHHQSTHTGDGAPNGWLLYRDLENPADAYWQPVIRRSGSLSELVVWCYCNGLLTRATRLNVRGGTSSVTVAELRELLGALSVHLPMPLQPASREALDTPARPLSNLLFINIGVDPQAHLTERGLHKLSARHDSLGFSGGRENLVLTIDQVTLNSWNEISLQHYSAGDTIIQCLKNVLASVAATPAALPSLSVHCYSTGHGNTIARRVEELFADVQRHFFAGGRGPHQLRYIIEMDRRFFVLQFHGNEPGFVGLANPEALMRYLQKPQSSYVPVVLDRYALQDNVPLRTVCHNSEPNNVQVFYLVSGQRATLWVVDELGSLFCWQRPYPGRRHLLAPLFRFLENLLERRQLRNGGAMASEISELRCYELVARGGQWHAERRSPFVDDMPRDGVEVQAVGIQEGDSRLRFDIFCGDQEFTVQEYGDRLIPAVAHYLRSLRRAGETSPVYLTDLHLPHDLDPNMYQQDLQTTQYLYYRAELERVLNAAMAG